MVTLRYQDTAFEIPDAYKSFVVCHRGNRLHVHVPEEYVSRVEEELGIESGVEITREQFRQGVRLLNKIRFEQRNQQRRLLSA